MKRLIHFLMLSCAKAAALVDKRLVMGLTRKERLQLRMHTSVCDACKNYAAQSKQLDAWLHDHIMNKNFIPVAENNELKERIMAKL